eukprot:6141031-Pyramimonas_sp.AAC.1
MRLGSSSSSSSLLGAVIFIGHRSGASDRNGKECATKPPATVHPRPDTSDFSRSRLTRLSALDARSV